MPSACTLRVRGSTIGARGRRVFAHGAELDFRGAALIPRKSSCEVRSTLRHLALHFHNSLVVFRSYFKVGLWVGANRANIRGFCAYYNVPAVAAFPNFDLGLLKNLRGFKVVE